MQSDRDHALEHARRRLDMDDAVLFTPGSKPGGVLLSLHGNRQVLMPGDSPVRVSRLVEINGAHRKTRSAEERARQIHQRRTGGSRLEGRYVRNQQPGAPSPVGDLCGRDGKVHGQRVTRRRGVNARHDAVTEVLECAAIQQSITHDRLTHLPMPTKRRGQRSAVSICARCSLPLKST